MWAMTTFQHHISIDSIETTQITTIAILKRTIGNLWNLLYRIAHSINNKKEMIVFKFYCNYLKYGIQRGIADTLCAVQRSESVQQTSSSNCRKKNISTRGNATCNGAGDSCKHGDALMSYNVQDKKTSNGGNRSVFNGKGKKIFGT